MKQHFFWTTACIIRETAQTVTIVFNTKGDDLVFKAGQFVNITLPINGEKVTRSYSLSSAPEHSKHPAITVKAVEGGVMSNYIVSHAEEIDVWEVEGPHGLFHLTEAIEQKPWIVLVAGGSGITPLYSILKHVLTTSAGNVLLVNSNKTEADVIFADALAYMLQSFSHRLKIVQVFTQPGTYSTARWNEVVDGRISRIRLKKVIKQYTGDAYLDADYFACGPGGLLKLAEEVTEQLGIPSTQFHKESFVPVTDESASKLPDSVMEVLLHHYDQTNLLEVAPGKTILETALEDHVPIQYSCKNGACGVCMAKLLSGDVYMRQNYVLTGEQVNEGYILLCQSHPLNSHVTVETVAAI